MQTIIVPVDFSKAAVNAAYYACDIAMLVNASVILMHTVVTPVTISEVPVPYDYEQAIADARREIALLKGWLEKYTNDKLVITTRITAGGVLGEVKQLAEDVQPLAIVMAAQEVGAVEALLLGSYTQVIANELDYPLIVVPHEVHYRQIRKIGLACDMEDVDKTLPVKAINNLLQYIKAPLEVFYVSKPGHEKPEDVLQGSVTIQNELGKYHPDIHIQEYKDVEGGIYEFVRANDIDLLLVVFKDRNFPESIFHRSVHKKLLVHTTVPLILLHK